MNGDKIGTTVVMKKNEQVKSMPFPPPGGLLDLAQKIVMGNQHTLLKFGRDIIAVRTRRFDEYFSSEPLPAANGSSSSSSSPKKSNLKKRNSAGNGSSSSPNKRVRIAVPNSSTTWTQQTVGEYTVYIGKPYLTEEEFKKKDKGEVATVEQVTVNGNYIVQVSDKSNRYPQKMFHEKFKTREEWTALSNDSPESASSSSSGSSSSKKSDDLSDNDVSSSPYVKVSKDKIQIDKKDWPRIYAKENGRWVHVTHGVSEQNTALDFTTFNKETIQSVTVEIMNNFTLYGVDIGPAEGDPPTTVVVREKENLALRCFTEKVYMTESKLLQFDKAEIGMECESVKVYDGDRYNNTYDIGTAIGVYNGQHVENQVIVFFMEQKATSVSSSSSSSSNLQVEDYVMIPAANDVTKTPQLCVLDGKVVTYLGKDNDKDDVYTDPHDIEVKTVGGKHKVKKLKLPPTKTPRKKKRKRGDNPFPGWTQIPSKKGSKPYIANDKIWKGNAFFDKPHYVKIHGQGTWMRTDEYERLENAKWDGNEWIFKDESSSSKKQRTN